MAGTQEIEQLISYSIAQVRPICLDSSAILEYLAANEPISTLIAPILEQSAARVVLSAMTLSEVLVRPIRDQNHRAIEAIDALFAARLNLALVVFDRVQAFETALVRAETQLKLPDCAVIAAARTNDATAIAGCDRKWASRHLGVPFYYLPDLAKRP